MKIAVLGAGAMGMLIGGNLSRGNDVTLIDVNHTTVEKIKADGVRIREQDGTVHTVRPDAVSDTAGMAPVDLVIVFVKAMYSRDALKTNRGLIGPQTYLLTLQNGAGHEDTMLEFTDPEHVVLGTTQHNSSVTAAGEINHGGSGRTYFGGLAGNLKSLQPIADAFNASGLEAELSDNVQKLIWDKLFTNVSASALTGALQCPLGYIVRNPHAWALCELLVAEAVAVANGDGMGFSYEEKLTEVRRVCENAPEGYTSIYADLNAGRKSEVDTISGAVKKASRRNGVPAPGHAFLIGLIHALEGKEFANESRRR